jgi:hypothetical protein
MKVARPAGLEPATPALEGRCSIQMSYGRLLVWYAERRTLMHPQVPRAVETSPFPPNFRPPNRGPLP